MSLAKNRIDEIEASNKRFYKANCLTKSLIKTIHTQNHYKLSSEERVLLFFDQTIFGNGKVGVLFTSEKVYFNDDNNIASLRYDEIEDVDSEKGVLGYSLVINSKKMPIGSFIKDEVSNIQEAISSFREFNQSELIELNISVPVEKSSVESPNPVNNMEGMHHCTNCNAEGKIEKRYSRGSVLIAFALIFAGGIPAFFYVFFYMKSWKACSECEATNLVALDKWRKNNPNKIEKEIESVA